MVLIEHLLRLLHVDRGFRCLQPRDIHQPLEVGPRHVVLSGGGIHRLQPLKLAVSRLARLRAHLRLRNLLLQLNEVRPLLAALAKLLLDRLELLAQEVLALGLAKLIARVLLHPRLQLKLLDLARHEGHHPAEARVEVDGLEDLLPLLHGQLQDGHRHVGQRAGMLEVERLDEDLLGQVWRHLHEPPQQVQQRLVPHADLVGDLCRLLDLLDLRPQERLSLRPLGEAHPGEAAHEQAAVGVGELNHLLNDRDEPHVIEALRPRTLLLCVALSDQSDHPVVAERGVDQLYIERVGHGERSEHAREYHAVEQAHHGQFLRDRRSTDALLTHCLFGQLHRDAHFPVCLR